MIVVRGFGPVYWGVEGDARNDPKVVSRAWLVEIEPPFRKSIVAMRVRWKDYALHLGLCTRVKEAKESVDMIGRNLDVAPDEIRTWGGKSSVQEEASPSS